MTGMPLFPGDTEGFQILEQIAILGNPTEVEYNFMEQMIGPVALDLVKKVQRV